LKVAREVHQQTGRPIIFISKFSKELDPTPAPGFLIHEFLDHAVLFPHARAVVHNGGIGVTAQCMRAGVPQAVVPLVWDQPDNAERIESLGIGVSIPPSELSTATMVDICNRLDAIDRKQLLLVASSVRCADAIPRSMDYAEQVIRSAGLM